MALLAHPPQPLHHHLGLHGITNDGDFFEQLTCTTSNYEPPRHYPSIHPAASSPSSGLVGSLQLNKQLPPLPSEDESDEIPTQPRGQATGVDRPAPQTTSLSIYPPPSPKSRNSASTSPETSTSIPDSNHFGTSMTSSFVGSPSSAAFSPLLSDSSSSGQAAQLPSELTEQSPSHLDAGLAESTMSPSSPALQLVTHNHTPLEEDPAFQLSSPVRTSLIANWDWDSSGPERSPVTEKKAHEPRQTWFVPNGNHHSSGIGRSHVMEDEPLVTILPTLRSSKSYPRRKCSLSGKPMPSVPPPLRRFQVPPSPSYPPQSATTKRKRTEGHSQPPSPDVNSFPHVSVDHSRKRSRHHHHQLSRSSSLSSSGGTSSSSSSQPIHDSSTLSTLSSAVGWVYTLPLTLEELFSWEYPR